MSSSEASGKFGVSVKIWHFQPPHQKLCFWTIWSSTNSKWQFLVVSSLDIFNPHPPSPTQFKNFVFETFSIPTNSSCKYLNLSSNLTQLLWPDAVGTYIKTLIVLQLLYYVHQLNLWFVQLFNQSFCGPYVKWVHLLLLDNNYSLGIKYYYRSLSLIFNSYLLFCGISSTTDFDVNSVY